MPLATYNDLLASVAGFLNRQDLTAVIPDFVTLAEARFSRRIRARQMLVVNTSFSISDSIVNLPSDFREMRRLALRKYSASQPSKPLQYLTPDRIADKLDEYQGVAGEPAYWSINATRLQIAPTPDVTYTTNILYYGAIPALSGSVNWLYSNHPDVYLYGALLQSAPYLKDDDRLTVWAQLHDSIIQEINDEAVSSLVGGEASINMQPKVVIG